MLKTYSDNYIGQNKALHDAPRGFGSGGANRLKKVLELITKYHCHSMLDYGAGQNTLSKALAEVPSIPVIAYDPAVPEISQKPPADIKFDLVTCTDVLEHIEPEFLDAVITELYSYTGKACHLLIACTEANKTLPDGRNAHLIQKPPEWWEDKLTRFDWSIAESVKQWDKYKPNTVKKWHVTLVKNYA